VNSCYYNLKKTHSQEKSIKKSAIGEFVPIKIGNRKVLDSVQSNRGFIAILQTACGISRIFFVGLSLKNLHQSS
jgi:hypothetical protein